jgi:hypothetical protein
LDVNALCAGSIAAITTGAAAIAPYGAAVHAACRYNHLLKTPKVRISLVKNMEIIGLGGEKHGNHWILEWFFFLSGS